MSLKRTLPGGQFRGVLSFESIGKIEAIEWMVEVVEHRSDIGAAFHRGQPEGVMTFEGVRPHRSARDVFFEQNIERLGLLVWYHDL